jgi:metal-responsive CopG/Arc/MetJ family transcriptional regulator
MREILSISLDKSLKNKVEKTAERLSVSKSELVKKAIEKYIAHEDLKDIRSILLPYAEKAGFYTDEDVFKHIS